MLKILHIMGCSDAGGISSVVRSFYTFIDRQRFHFDIALTVPEQGQNSRALEGMGAKIYFIPLKAQDRQGFARELTRILKDGHYDGIHVHESETSYVALRLAKQLGIPCRIAHAHTSSPYEGLRGVVRRWSGCLLNCVYATHAIACGKLAGDRVFGKINMRLGRAVVLPNAVDTKRFAFDPQVRQEVRRELGAEDCLVLGMVTRLSEEKNVVYGPEVLKRLLKAVPNAILAVAGNGPEEENLRRKVEELGLQDRVRILGRRGDVERLYQAYDLFLLPSIHEGFPVAAVEALSSGLPVLMSDTITKELSCYSGVTYLPLSDPEVWAKKAASLAGDEGRAARQGEPRAQGMDIRDSAEVLSRMYRQDVEKYRK